MNPTTREAVLSAVRTLILSPAGTWLAAQGWFAGTTSEVISGALLVLVSAAWGAWDKYQSEKKAAEREHVAVISTIEAIKTDPKQIAVPVTSDDTKRIIKDFNPTNGVPKP